MAEPDILTGERAIIDVQWRKIGELPVPDLFSAETVMAFYLRLRLLEREHSWDLERGQAVLDEIQELPELASVAPVDITRRLSEMLQQGGCVHAFDLVERSEPEDVFSAESAVLLATDGTPSNRGFGPWALVAWSRSQHCCHR